jgi:hypothetical protein
MIVEIYDRRLGPGMPRSTSGCTVLTVDRNFPLAVPLSTAKVVGDKSPITLLRIFGHGNSGELQLGKEEINSSTTYLFKLLDGAFESDALIALYSCQSVMHLKPSVGPGNDAVRSSLPSYVKQIAAITNVPVLATPELQFYDGQTLDFGKWEGRLYVITPAGMVVAAPNVASWREDDMAKVGLSKGAMRLIQAERDGPNSKGETPFVEEPIWKHNRF